MAEMMPRMPTQRCIGPNQSGEWWACCTSARKAYWIRHRFGTYRTRVVDPDISDRCNSIRTTSSHDGKPTITSATRPV